MGKTFRTTLPVQGDRQNALLGKLLQRLGGQPQFGDSDVMILRRILERLSGVNPAPDLDPPALIALILTALSECPEGDGGDPDLLTLSGTLLTTYPPQVLEEIQVLSLPEMTDDGGGQLQTDLSNMASLVTLDIRSLPAVDDSFELNNHPDLVSVNVESLATVPSDFSIDSTLITTLNLLSLVTVGGDMAASSNPLLTTFSAPVWVPTDVTNISFADNALSTASVNHILARCASAGVSSITLNVSGGTNSIPVGQGVLDLVALYQAGNSVTTNLVSYSYVSDADFTAQTGALEAISFNASAAVSLFNSGVTHVLQALDFAGSDSLTDLEMSGLVLTFQGISTSECDLLETIDFNSLTQCSGLSGFSCPALTSVSFSALTTNGGACVYSGCPNLATVVFTSWVPTNGNAVDFSGSGLNAASINHILARLVANVGYVSGTVDLSGGTNAAPTGQGIADAATLFGRGVTISTN